MPITDMDYLSIFHTASFIKDYNLFATIDLGLLAIITIVFGLTSLRKQIDDDFDEELRDSLKGESPKRRDVIITQVKEEKNRLKNIINSVSWWFRKCMYVNLIAILLILVSSIWATFFFDVIISLILIGSLVVIVLNIHRLKHIMDLDTKLKIQYFIDKLNSAEKIKTLDLKSRFEMVLNQSKA